MATTMSMLAGLMQGYDSAAKSAQAQKLDDLKQQRGATLDIMRTLMASPNVHPQHQQEILQKYVEALHGDPTKPIKFDPGALSIIRPSQAPPVQTPSFTGQAAPMQIQAPQDPNGPNLEPAQIPGQQVTIPGRSIPMPLGPPVNPNGGLVMRSPEEMANQQTQMEIARAQQLRAAGVLPPERPTVLAPGAAAFDSSGKQIASNTNPKPGDGPKVLSSGNVPYGIEANGKFYRGSESDKMPPEIKAQWQAVEDSQKQEENKQQKKDATTLNRELTVQTQAMRNAIQMGAVKDAQQAKVGAQKALEKIQSTSQQDESRYDIMKKSYDAIKKDPANVGSFDAALLAFHMGMTVGTIKGARTGKDLILMHEKARSLGEDFDVALGRIEKGQLLSDEQRSNFLTLANEKMAQSRQQAEQAKGEYDRAYSEYSGLVKAASGGKASLAAPVSPSGKVLTQAQIMQAAKDHGVSVDEARRQAIGQGYSIK